MADLQSVEFAQKEAERIEQEMASLKAAAKKEIEIEFKGLSIELKTIHKGFTRLYQQFENSDDEDLREELRPKLLLSLQNKRETLQRGGRYLSLLPSELLQAFDISTGAFNPQQTQQALSEVQRYRKLIYGEPVPIQNDEELEKSLKVLSDRKKEAQTLWASFEDKAKSFNGEGQPPLSPPAKDKSIATLQQQVVELGKMALGKLNLVGGHTAEIRKYLTEEKAANSEVLKKEPDLLEEVLLLQKQMTKGFMQKIRGGKVKAPLLKLDELQSKKQLQKALSSLANNELLTKHEPPKALSSLSAHALFFSYATLFGNAKKVLKAVENAGDKPVTAQQELLQMRAQAQSWLSEYQSVDVNEINDGEELKELAVKVETLIKDLQEGLVNIGGYAINKDNFPEVMAAYSEASEKLAALEGVYAAYQETEALLKKEDLSEEQQKAAEEEKGELTATFLDTVDDTEASVKTFIQKASEWAVAHESEWRQVGLERKQETLYQKSQELYMRSYALDMNPDLDFRTFRGMSKIQPKEYKAKKDKGLKKINSLVKELKKLASEGGHHNKRFTLLGDLNNALQDWAFKHRFYRSEQLGDSEQAIETAKTYFKEEFELVKAQKSMKTLSNGMDDRLYKYATRFLKMDKKPDKGKERAKLLVAATELMEFIELWNQNYTQVKEALGDDIDDKLVEKKKEMDKFRRMIEKFDMAELTQSDRGDKERIDEVENCNSQLQKLQEQQNALLREKRELQEAFDELDKPSEDATDEEREKYEEKKRKLEELEQDLTESIEKREQLQERVQELENDLYGFKGSASQLFARLHQGFEKLEINYDDSATAATNTKHWSNLEYLLQLVRDWRKTVINPQMANLETTHAEVLRIESELLKVRRQFLEKRPKGKDVLYPRIEKAWEVAEKEGIDEPLGKKVKTKEALQQLLYIQKLIRYWEKENPTNLRDEEEEKKAKQLNAWNDKIEQEMQSGRFGLLKIVAEAESILQEAEELLEQLAFDAEERRREAMGRQIYNSDDPKSFEELLNWCAAVDHKVKDWRKRPDAIRKQEDALKMRNSATAWSLELSEYYRNSQVELGEKLQKKEQLAFAGLSDGDYDYENSGVFEPEQIALMNKMMEQAMTRARAIMQAGGSFKEAEATVAHIPTTVLPDEFIEQLRAFAITEKALREEQEQTAQEQATKALGLHEIILDKDLNANMGLVVSQLTNLDSLTTYKQWSEKDNKYETLYIGTDDKSQAQAHKVVANVGNFLDTAFSSIAAFNKIKESLSQEEKRKMAADYLFKGELDFEEEGSDVGHVKNPKDKLISDRKRSILLAGMNVVAKISGTVDNTAGTYVKEVAPEFSATMQGISLFFSEVANLIDGTTNADDIARSTEQLWQDRFQNFETAAKALLATGTGIAKAVALFGEIPAGILPGLGIAANALNLAINIKGIAEKLVLRHRTVQLQNQAKLFDRSYIGPLQQEISSLNRRIAKQSIEAGTDALAMAGGIVDAAGVTYGVGTAITLVAGALKAANELVFTGINEAQMAKARKLLKKARAGDRQAKIDIMQNSPIYAKMFIAIGATENPPNAIALEFIRQRGITERDIKNAGTSTMIVRRFLRKQLLEKSEEQDSHEGKRILFKAIAAKFRAWRAEAKAKQALWSGERKDYATLTSLYAVDKIHKSLEENVKYLKTMDGVPMDEMEAMLFESILEQVHYLNSIFQAQLLSIRREQREVKKELEETIATDKNTKDLDYAPQIARLEQNQETLVEQEEEVQNLLDIVALL